MLINREAYAKQLGISRQALLRYIRENRLKVHPGRYTLPNGGQCVCGLIESTDVILPPAPVKQGRIKGGKNKAKRDNKYLRQYLYYHRKRIEAELIAKYGPR